jgi:hypothetical protein
MDDGVVATACVGLFRDGGHSGEECHVAHDHAFGTGRALACRDCAFFIARMQRDVMSFSDERLGGRETETVARSGDKYSGHRDLPS